MFGLLGAAEQAVNIIKLICVWKQLLFTQPEDAEQY